MSLYISRTFRERYLEAEGKSVPAGKVPVLSTTEARRLAETLGLVGLDEADEAFAVTAGELAALALLDDVYLAVLAHHLRHRDSTLIDRLLSVLRAQVGLDLIDRLLIEFAEEYLGMRLRDLALLVDGGAVDRSDEWDRSRILQQIVVFTLLHGNPAARPLVDRIHASPLLEVPAFQTLFQLVAQVLDREPGYRQEDGSLWQLLTRPQRLSPHSLSGQLFHLRQQWHSVLGELGERLDTFIGMLAEEQAHRFPPGPGPSEVPRFEPSEDEVRYSQDLDWMSGLVLVAKHTLVWLHQLSHTYGQRIERLDQIPDAELERLAALGFNGLWLIGVWQRSPASRRIKHLCGNPEAEASAYSLVRYAVAEELGGEPALANLRRRAAGFGIRLGADMVPNHTGLDSDWLADHPDWFIGQDHCPFPAYRFSGEDLSRRSEMGIQLEDHYFDRSDAAVVFRREDRRTGAVRFIYHGNDGTSMPWNDTAQLDYLHPEVRSAALEAIVQVARQFPIIRFDAAMTLTRRHFQRLWFPAPGTAGAIPSRAEHGMSPEQFQEAMPEEFWQQVVDRVAEEAPDTLLLAEAFWLMEGYFVRTLGMHRVYNSAFMNMLRDGETDKFRSLIKETLAFDPGILRRYVNFMSNPDELSAIEQFGDGDRYFGTCMVMATLPGLPMFGHGQVEGFSERYGMEYRQSYRDESVRVDMVERHQRQIVPLLRRRDLFADVEHFRLFDLVAFAGEVDGRVLAYLNGTATEKVLVLFNNSDQPAHGRLKVSAPFLPESAGPEAKARQEPISRALAIGGTGYWQYRDALSRREFLVDAGDLEANGLEVDLAPWQGRVLWQFEPARWSFEMASRIWQRTGSRGADSLDRVRIVIELEPLRQAMATALDESLLQRLMQLPGGLIRLGDNDALLEEMHRAADGLASDLGQDPSDSTPHLLALMTLPVLARRLASSRQRPHRQAGLGLEAALRRRPEMLPTLFCWVLLRVLHEVAGDRLPNSIRDWQLDSTLLSRLVAAGGEPETVGRLVSVLEQASRLEWGREPLSAPEALAFQHSILTDDELRRTLGAHTFEGGEYVGREALEAVLDWRLLLEAQAWSAGSRAPKKVPGEVTGWWRVIHRMDVDAEKASYRTDLLGIVDSTEPESTEAPI